MTTHLLPVQDVEIISLEGLVFLIGSVPITLLGSYRYQRTDGTGGFARGSFPVQAVLFAGIAIDLLRIHMLLAVVGLPVIFFLRVHQFTANLDCGQFVFANSAIENFLLPGRSVEIPGVALVNQRDRRGPIFGADVESGGAVGLRDQTMHLAVFVHELIPVVLVFRVVARRNKVFGIRSQNFQQCRLIIFLDGFDQRLGSLGSRGKRLLSGLEFAGLARRCLLVRWIVVRAKRILVERTALLPSLRKIRRRREWRRPRTECTLGYFLELLASNVISFSVLSGARSS